MDLNVKLQRLKYNFKKNQGGCFCKIPGLQQIPGLLNYFSIKNWWNRSTGVVDRVHNLGSRVDGIGISSGPFNSRSRARIISREEVWLDLISVVHLGGNDRESFFFLRP
jgi:hypothetical protein